MNPEKRIKSIPFVKDFLSKLLFENLSVESFEWISDKVNRKLSQDIIFFQDFGKIPSVLGKKELILKEKLLMADIDERWSPAKLRIDQAARILYLLSFAENNEKEFEGKIRSLYKAADVGELITLYLAFPLFPSAGKFMDLAVEGVRSNMKSVFEAIALENSYPNEHFEINSWNQMVLKAVFLGCPLHRIYGLDKRSNSRLVHMLSDFAHERWLAGRKVNPDVWRIVGPFMDETIFEDIKEIVANGSQLEKEAGVLACDMSNFLPAKKLLNDQAELKIKIMTKEITWDSISKKLYPEKLTELI